MSTSSAPALPLLTIADLPAPLDVVLGEGDVEVLDGGEAVIITIPEINKRLVLDAVAVLDLARIAIERARHYTDWSDALHGALDWRGLAVELCPTPSGVIRLRPAGMARGVPTPGRWRWWTPQS